MHLNCPKIEKSKLGKLRLPTIMHLIFFVCLKPANARVAPPYLGPMCTYQGRRNQKSQIFYRKKFQFFPRLFTTFLPILLKQIFKTQFQKFHFGPTCTRDNKAEGHRFPSATNYQMQQKQKRAEELRREKYQRERSLEI